MTSEPLFIIGNPRSGTSLLRSLLNAHPSLCIPPECGFLLWLHADWKDTKWDQEAIGGFATAVFTSRKFETWGIEHDTIVQALSMLPIGSYADAASRVYRAYAAAKGKPNSVWGDKNNYYIQHVSDLRAIFSQARFVHIVRDVRDVACSYRELGRKDMASVYKPQLEQDCASIAAEWSANNLKARQALDGARHIRIRYEDLVAHVEPVLNSIFSFLGVEQLSGTSRELHIRNLDEPKEFLQWKQKLSAPVDAASVGRYRQELPLAEIARIELEAGTLMAEFGYLPEVISRIPSSGE